MAGTTVDTGAAAAEFYCEATGRLKTMGRETIADRVEGAME